MSVTRPDRRRIFLGISTDWSKLFPILSLHCEKGRTLPTNTDRYLDILVVVLLCLIFVELQKHTKHDEWVRMERLERGVTRGKSNKSNAKAVALKYKVVQKAPLIIILLFFLPTLLPLFMEYLIFHGVVAARLIHSACVDGIFFSGSFCNKYTTSSWRIERFWTFWVLFIIGLSSRQSSKQSSNLLKSYWLTYHICGVPNCARRNRWSPNPLRLC